CCLSLLRPPQLRAHERQERYLHPQHSIRTNIFWQPFRSRAKNILQWDGWQSYWGGAKLESQETMEERRKERPRKTAREGGHTEMGNKCEFQVRVKSSESFSRSLRS